MSTITILVPGEPVAKARARVFWNSKAINKHTGEPGVMMAITPKRTMTWEEHIRQCASQVFPGPLLLGPIRMEIGILKPIPKSFSKKKLDLIKQSRCFPQGRPDLDNYEKSVLDALNNIVWKDDSQVIEKHSFKKYSDYPHVIIVIEEII